MSLGFSALKAFLGVRFGLEVCRAVVLRNCGLKPVRTDMYLTLISDTLA